MKICLFDDSVTFDAWTPGRRPLGGAEKAFALLPSPLAAKGHDVHVYNRCRYSMPIEGARWHSPEGSRPLETDVLIAFRKLTLLDSMRGRHRRILWATAAPEYLTRKAAARFLEDVDAELVLVSKAQQDRYQGNRSTTVIRPGVAKAYLREDLARDTDAPPRAVVTTHPNHGLDWLIDLWINEVRPKVPDAELDIYSASLDRAMQDPESAPEALEALVARCLAARRHGVAVLPPLGDEGMAKAYANASVHLYPGTPTTWRAGHWPTARLRVARPSRAVFPRWRNGWTTDRPAIWSPTLPPSPM